MAKVTRFEVIDDTGRVYSHWPCEVELSFQDGGKTLKVFVKHVEGPKQPDLKDAHALDFHAGEPE